MKAFSKIILTSFFSFFILNSAFCLEPPFDLNGYVKVSTHRIVVISVASIFILILLLLLSFFLFLWQRNKKRHFRELYYKEKELSDSKEKYKTLHDNISVGLYTSTPSGKIVDCNPAFCKILGYKSYEELKNLSITTQVYKNPSLRKKFKDMVEKDGIVKGYQSEISKSDGTTLFLRESAYAEKDEKGDTIFYHGIVEDVTSEIKAQLELKEANALWNKIFDNIKDAVFLVDQNQIILKANRAFQEIYGVDIEKAIHLHCYEVCHKRENPIEECPFLTASSEKKRITETMEFDGKIYEVTVDPIFDEYGKLTDTVHITTDVTEKVKAQREKEKLLEQISQIQKVEAIGRLAGGIAHDFNNFLAVILGNIELMQKYIDKTTPIYQNLKEMEESAKKSTELTRQLLGFARKQTINPKVVNINDHLKSMSSVIRRLIGENIEIVFEFDNNIFNTKIDPIQFDQIVINLLVNCKDAIGEKSDGKILVETRTVTVEEEYVKDHLYAKKGRYVQLSISDNGCGISEEILPHIFEPFFTTKKKDKGTGLGLSTVYGIVRQNEGFLNVYSEVGVGTTFKVYLPITEEKILMEAEVKEEDKKDTLLKTILLVEDEPPILKMVKTMLENKGFKVFAFDKPSLALKFAKESKENIALLISDVIMPQMNGKVLFEGLKETNPELKVLFMSGYTANVIAHNGILDKDINFIEKPFTSKSLLKKISEII